MFDKENLTYSERIFMFAFKALGFTVKGACSVVAQTLLEPDDKKSNKSIDMDDGYSYDKFTSHDGVEFSREHQPDNKLRDNMGREYKDGM